MPTTIEALVIVALVLSPGFVFARTAGGVLPFSREPGELRVLLHTITLGTLVHVVLSWWTMRILRHYREDTLDDHPAEIVVWGAVLVFIVPALLGVAVGRVVNHPSVNRWLDKVGLGYIDRMPSAWDYWTRSKRAGFVRVHLKDGGVLGGVMFDKSFASTNPERADLFLEEAWELNDKDGFEAPLATTQGMWISQDAMEYVELFLPVTQTQEESHEDPNGHLRAK